MSQKDIDKLILWAEKLGYTTYIEPDCLDEICYTSKNIEINSEHSDEKKLFIMLHECGHIITIKDKKFFNYRNNHLLEDCLSKRVITFAEEFDAWKAGLKLSKKLNIKVEEEKYLQEALSAITLYAQWANKIK
jgi:hypothetical protein